MYWVTLLTEDGGRTTVRVDVETQEEAVRVAAWYFLVALPWKWGQRQRTRTWRIRWKPRQHAAA